jgi:SMC interacting uncharacterized protein involved in chromosome segregation
LSSQVEALTKEKKEKENVLIELGLINLKSDSLLKSKKNRKRITKAKIKKTWWASMNICG